MAAQAWKVEPGTRRNLLTFMHEAPSRRYPGGTLVRCGWFKCDCGTESVIPIFRWKYGRTKWCAEHPVYGPFRSDAPRVYRHRRITPLPLIGEKRGRLTLVEFISPTSLDSYGNPLVRGKFLCDKCDEYFNANIRCWRADRYYSCVSCINEYRKARNQQLIRTRKVA